MRLGASTERWVRVPTVANKALIILLNLKFQLQNYLQSVEYLREDGSWEIGGDLIRGRSSPSVLHVTKKFNFEVDTESKRNSRLGSATFFSKILDSLNSTSADPKVLEVARRQSPRMTIRIVIQKLFYSALFDISACVKSFFSRWQFCNFFEQKSEILVQRNFFPSQREKQLQAAGIVQYILLSFSSKFAF